MRHSILTAATLLALLGAAPALAQYRTDDPNLRKFYMARQQIQIMDDAPLVNDMRTVPGQPGAAGALPQQPQALPRAGFTSYSSPALLNGGMKTGLPQVVNGVPPKLPPATGGGPTGQKATAQKMKKPAATTASAPSSTAAKAYTPYKTYQTSGATGGGNSGSMFSSSGNVHGSVLHWNKKRPQGY